MKEQQITDKADLRRWRIELPNLYDDADLDPFEFRLIAHYKRVGTCTESTATTAEKCHMSAGKVSQTRLSLAKKGLITLTEVKIHGGKAYSIDVVDMWEENFAKYSAMRSKTPSPHEQAPSPHEQAPSPHETKKEPIKKEHEGRKQTVVPTSKHPVIETLREITRRYPPANLHETLIAALSDVPKEKLKSARETWLLRGYNPNAYTWATEWAVKGIPGKPGPAQPAVKSTGGWNLKAAK
jgi:hypothetical protein